MLNEYFARGNEKVLLARRNLSVLNYRKIAVFRPNSHSKKRKFFPRNGRFVKRSQSKEINKKGIRKTIYGYPYDQNKRVLFVE